MPTIPLTETEFLGRFAAAVCFFGSAVLGRTFDLNFGLNFGVDFGFAADFAAGRDAGFAAGFTAVVGFFDFAVRGITELA